MTPSGHIAASLIVAPLGAGPLGSFFMGVFQHALLDYTTPEFRLVWAQRDGSINWPELRRQAPYIAGEILLALVGLWLMRLMGWKAVWAVVGYAATELPDVIRSARDPDVWYRGDHLMPFHRKHSGPSPPAWSPLHTLGFAAVLLGASFWFAL